MADINESVLINRIPEPEGGFGWRVSVIRATGRHKGKEHCLALVCGGAIGKALATMCARHVAEAMRIDEIHTDPELTTTED